MSEDEETQLDEETKRVFTAALIRNGIDLDRDYGRATRKHDAAYDYLYDRLWPREGLQNERRTGSPFESLDAGDMERMISSMKVYIEWSCGEE